MKPRIHILGGPGSGKSYVAARLATQFGISACDLDDLFWDRTALKYGVRAETKERTRQLADIVSQDGWVIEGVYYQWLAPSFKSANLIIALTPSIWIRHGRVIKRFLLRKFGRIKSKRESFADLLRLLRWSHNYDATMLVQAREFISQQGRELAVYKTFDDVMNTARSRITWPQG